MYKAKYLSPMIPSFNIEKTASFFIDLLQFKVKRNDKTYVVLCKDKVMLHILSAGTDIGEMEFYLEVDDIATIWNSIQHKLEGIKVKEPFDQAYGMREVHIIIPETKTLLFIGQEIK
jgi:hypothetical protein